MMSLLSALKELKLSTLRKVTSPYLKALFLLHFLYLYQIHVNANMGGFYFNVWGIAQILLSFVPLACLFYVVNFGLNRYPKGLLVGNAALTILYGVLAAYHFDAKAPFEWAMLSDNISNAFYLESLVYMWSSLNKDALVYMGVFLIIMGVMEWRHQGITRYQRTLTTKRPIWICLAVYLVFIGTSLPCYDPISTLMKSGIVHYFKPNLVVAYQPGQYPVLQKGTDLINAFTPQSTPKKPSVFLIIVESLNHSAIHQKTKAGKEVTPFLNQLENRSVIVDHFYGNSIQSARGQLSIFFSLIPSIADKVSSKYPNTTLQSIGQVMRDEGYDSVFFQAQKYDGFDNNYQFLGRNGFEMVRVTPFLKKEDAPYIWRDWGPEDTAFYKRFFDYYDQKKQRTKPLFVALSTVATHYPFSAVPKDRRFMYPEPSSIHEEYANIIHLADKGIEAFFKELKKRGLLEDNIVIVTSDHAMPMGEHGIYHQEVGFYEESFRIPFWIHWPKELSKRTIKGPFSQMDIGPTIVDLVDATPKSHHFMGKSIFSDDPSPVFLVQPYGKYLSVVKWPYKSIWHSRSGKATVYNLEEDPLEKTNIAGTLSTEALLEFDSLLKVMGRQQRLYELNEIFR